MVLNIVDVPLVNPGVEFVPSKVDEFTTNRVARKEDTAAYTKRINTRAELIKRFIDIPTLRRKELPSDTIVETIDPTGPYSAGAGMTIALSSEVVQNKRFDTVDGEPPTLTIYDFPEDAKVEYFTQIVGAMDALESEYTPFAKGKFRVVATENAAIKVSDNEHRTARTIKMPHTQEWTAREDLESYEPEKIDSLHRKEKTVMGLINNRIEDGLENLFQDTKDHANRFTPHIRRAAPYGYILETDISRDMSVKDRGAALSKLMTAHHERYTLESAILAKELEDSHKYLHSRLIPQPSYKLFYVYNERGMLEISVSPTFFASTGVVEVLNREIDRNPNNPPFFESDAAEAEYYKRVSNKLADF